MSPGNHYVPGTRPDAWDQLKCNDLEGTGDTSYSLSLSNVYRLREEGLYPQNK